MTGQRDSSDRELLTAFAATRRVELLEEIVRRHQGPVLRLAACWVGAGTSAQVVAERVFARVARRPARFNGTREPGLELLRETRREACKERFRGRRQVGGGSSSSTIEGVERSDGNGALAALDALAPAAREVLELRLGELLGYREIAAITGRTPTEVGRLAHEALGRLSGRRRP